MKKLSVIIPCYNEKKTIGLIIERIKEIEFINYEVIIIDDGSIDGTRELLKEKYENLVDKVIYHKTNFGKGAAVRSGLKYVTGEIILIQDADLEYNPSDYEILLDPFLKEKADIVYGSRFIGKKRRVIYFWHEIGNKFLTLLSNIFSGINLTDMESGYKCFKSDVVKDIEIKEDGFGFEPEITAKLAKKKLKFFEVGISYNARTYKDGKKIRPIDGIKAIYYIIKYNLFK